MTHLPILIQDLGYILIIAAVVGLLFRMLKQPVVLGYLIAGLLVGPHVTFIHTVHDIEGVKVWAEIGVIFLLFALGLEFSFKKLAKVGGPASVTALVEIIAMLLIGFVVGRMLGWSAMDSMFLGGILSISSTTIIVKAFDELGMKGRNFVSLVFGVLIVEDLVAILLLVLLSTVGTTHSFSGQELATSTLRLGFFLALWFLLGIYLLPLITTKLKRFLSDEAILITSIGLCLMMVMIATKVDFSPALGAFVMGSLLAETSEGHRIEKLMYPVRDLFAAVFFVSVGMLIDPKILAEHFWVVLLLTVVTIVGKLVSSTLGALVAGAGLKNSLQAGMSLAQIGEFSFIIATLGITLNATSNFLYPIAVAVSAITTFTTPYQIKYSTHLYHWLEKKLSPELIQRLARYQNTVSQSSGQSLMGLVWDSYAMKIGLNSVMVVAVTLAMTRLVLPMIGLNPAVDPSPWTSGLSCLVTIVATAPFLWAVVVSGPANIGEHGPEMVNKLKRLQFGVSIVRIIVGVSLVGIIVAQFVGLHATTGIIIGIFSILFLFFSRFSGPLYGIIENRFLINLNEKERQDQVGKTELPELAPWQATLVEFVITPYSTLVAKTLHQSQLKELFGLTVAMIQRGHQKILAPGKEDLLFPFDRLYLIGQEDQLAQARPVIEALEQPKDNDDTSHFGLDSCVLQESASFIGRAIRDSGIRDEVQGLIVGIERNGLRFLNPDSGMVLQAGDLLWIVGNKQKIAKLKKANS